MNNNALSWISAGILIFTFAASVHAQGSPYDKFVPKPIDGIFHSDTCPKGCPTCSEALTNALSWLAEQPVVITVTVKKPKEKVYVSLYVQVGAALKGLAFLSEGSTASKGKYAKAIAACRDYLHDTIKHKKRTFMKRGENARYSLQYCAEYGWVGLFLAELQRRDPTEKNKEVLTHVSKMLDESRFEHGFWGYCKGEIKKGHLFSTVHCLFGQQAIERAGISTNYAEYVSKIREAYKTKVLTDEGWVGGYLTTKMLRDPKEDQPRTGRVVATLLMMQNLGITDCDAYKKGLAYFRKNLDDVMTYHVPQLYVFETAILCQRLGGDDWKRYRELYLNKLYQYLEDDGGVLLLFDPRPRKLHSRRFSDLRTHMKPYATAMFILILQTPRFKELGFFESFKVERKPEKRQY